MPGPESAPGFDPSEFKVNPEQPEANLEYAERPVTPEALRQKAELALALFAQEFNVIGNATLNETLRANPEAKFVVAASHLADLDVNAAIAALGDRFDLQITHESVLLDSPQHQFMMWLAGRERFSPLGYREAPGGKHGVFNPEDFTSVAQHMRDEGRTPWIAIHPSFTPNEQMREAHIGPVYLAQKTGAKIIPTALELQGVSATLRSIGEITKAMASRVKGSGVATYRIGEVVDLPPVDVSIIETVMAKRARGERPTADERERFALVHEQLRAQADEVATKIAELLPPDRRGEYGEAHGESPRA